MAGAIEKDKEVLMAAEGIGPTSSRWERKVQHKARDKIKAALFLAEVGLKKMESEALVANPGIPAVSAPVKSATKRETSIASKIRRK